MTESLNIRTQAVMAALVGRRSMLDAPKKPAMPRGRQALRRPGKRRRHWSGLQRVQGQETPRIVPEPLESMPCWKSRPGKGEAEEGVAAEGRPPGCRTGHEAPWPSFQEREWYRKERGGVSPGNRPPGSTPDPTTPDCTVFKSHGQNLEKACLPPPALQPPTTVMRPHGASGDPKKRKNPRVFGGLLTCFTSGGRRSIQLSYGDIGSLAAARSRPRYTPF
jgi:hypothetical protein